MLSIKTQLLFKRILLCSSIIFFIFFIQKTSRLETQANDLTKKTIKRELLTVNPNLNAAQKNQQKSWDLFGFNEKITDKHLEEWHSYAQLWDNIQEREKTTPTFFVANTTNPTADSRLPKPYSDNWLYILKKSKTMDIKEKLRTINGLFNRQKRGADEKNFQQDEYWATPAEFCRIGGDCEDFAIAKYYALRALGLNPSELRIVIVDMLNPIARHAFLVVRVDNINFVLDNNTKPANLILPDTQLIHKFKPLWSFNEENSWQHYKTESKEK